MNIQPYADGVTIIVAVHDEFENAVRCIESVRMNAGAEDVDLIVADNHSTDRFREWAETQTDFTYVCFDEETLPYGSVLNQILQALDIRENVLIMSCRLMMTENCLQAMLETLYDTEHVGATGCISNEFLSVPQRMEPEEYECFEDAADFSVYGFMDDAVLFRTETLNKTGTFDDRLHTMISVMKDYSLRMIQEKITTRVCRHAYLYAFRSVLDEPEDILIRQNDDNDTLLDKWGIQYISVTGNHSIVELMDEPRDKPLQVLEIGCDIGATLFFIRETYPNAEIHGCDLNPASVRIASHAMHAFVNNIEEENLPFAKESLDVVIFGDVLEHLHNPAKTIRYVRTLLKDGGCILASIPNLMHISVMKGLLHGNFTYTDMGLLDKTHIHFFTFNEIVRMFRAENYALEVIRPSYIHISDEDMKLIQRLLALDNAAESYMYETFQYMVLARKRGQS